jgi:hypothetical protein
VLTFVLCRVAADGPSITFELASTSACALQSAAHCRSLHKTEDELNGFFELISYAFRMTQYSLCVPLLGHLIAGRGAFGTMQDIK